MLVINEKNFSSSPASPCLALLVSMCVAERRKKATEDEKARAAMIDNQIGTQPWRIIKTAGIYVGHSLAFHAFIPKFILPFCIGRQCLNCASSCWFILLILRM